MRRIILWGYGLGYEMLLNSINFEILKNNIIVEAIVCKPEEKYCDIKDGFCVDIIENIPKLQFDYIIVTQSEELENVRHTVSAMGVDKGKVLPGSLMEQPQFDFSRYASLIENPVTILSDDCWGGYVYHRLKLPFSSPLINIHWERKEFSKFIHKAFTYINSDLYMVREGNLDEGIWPIGRLGGDDCVQLEFVHNTCFEEAKEQFYRRRKRINPNNIFVKMGSSSNISSEDRESLLSSFEAVESKKILFFHDESVSIAGKMEADRYLWQQRHMSRVEYFNYDDYVRMHCFWDVDLLKLLNGDKDYSRYEG